MYSHTPPTKVMKSVSMMKEDAARNLIVNYIPAQWDENQFRNLFAQHGQVEKAKLITDQATGQSKGFGFITFSNSGEAARAMRELAGYEVLGKKLRVAYAQAAIVTGGPSPSVNVFFSGFGNAFDENYVRQLASKYGEVQDVRVLDNTKHPRGVAFARFANIAQAESCVHHLNGLNMSSPTGPLTLSVKYAERKQPHKPTRQGPGMHHPPSMLSGFHFNHMPHANHPADYPRGNEYPSQSGHMNTVFVHGLTGANEGDIQQAVYGLFSRIGRIVKVDVPKHATGEPRNFCFVHFADFGSAQAAIMLNGHDIGGRQLQVRFK